MKLKKVAACLQIFSVDSGQSGHGHYVEEEVSSLIVKVVLCILSVLILVLHT